MLASPPVGVLLHMWRVGGNRGVGLCPASDWESGDAAAQMQPLAPLGGAKNGSERMARDLV